MVSVVHSVATQGDDARSLQTLSTGLDAADGARLESALAFARETYGDTRLGSGEDMLEHGLGIALIMAGLKLDADSRLAALLFAVPARHDDGLDEVTRRFGRNVAHLVGGVSRLNRLRPITRSFVADNSLDDAHANSQETRAQVEVLRKMFLAMVEDIRMVLLRLASRTQTLRYYAANPDELRVQVARETLALYSPLANRLGVWELKWELEDLSFRFLYPETYRKIARMLDEKRIERELFIVDAASRLKRELQSLGIDAEIYGRPKHIYSIWSKMRRKGVDFSDLYDIRALRVIVNEIKDCYAVLGAAHNLWTPIPKEFDDYISNPKGNHYRSLHTAVRCPDGRSLEVQIRTREMHQHAELGVAAHWRYKEGGNKSGDDYDEKIAWLRRLLSWRDEVTDSSDWVRHYKQAALDETIYVLTPRGKVVDLPQGATPLDFAYRVHTDLGHRCRGAKVDGHLVSLNTALKTGQRVEIVVAKQGGPSRDWLNAAQGYIHTRSARSKVRQWFSNLALEETLSDGKSIIVKELQRLGHGGINLEEVAQRLNYARLDDLYAAAARNELPMRQFQAAVRNDEAPTGEPPLLATAVRPPTGETKGILIVGVDRLMTQLARCCKPAPPDEIEGFVTRGKGVSIHRVDCVNFQHLAVRHPERVIEADWGDAGAGGVFAADIIIDAHDRQGLLRDISEIFAKEKINVIGVNTQSRQGRARMGFTVEVRNLQQLKRTLGLVHEVSGVVTARRGG
ncbi:MAG: bifunctional (p)ppGpp synthetase/guanosine-3',5'-bis(diphosphate) 3'-pyrophosphohydrolase [Zoogloeaceae bacterium]|jgi:GTP pyrophosphokinase|nr:bifunctional (p)ppGpp synthetase/guanosine-3',5'-bis(diphosphate) 3'-pyrophosphohydrolase [Zoogloeaceae bacterium]